MRREAPWEPTDEQERWLLQTGILITHAAQLCQGQPCTLHNPSAHPLTAWPLAWDSRHQRMNRVCPAHGCLCPDPDDTAYRASRGDHSQFHACCGCCEALTLKEA